MRPTSSLVRLALCLAPFVQVASAWSEWLPEGDSMIIRADKPAPLVPRQTNTADRSTITDAPSTKSTASADDEDNNTDETDTNRDLNTAKPDTRTGTNTAKGSKTTRIPQDAPPAGVSILEPKTTPGDIALFKIGDYVELKWNYTSLISAPTAVDVLVSCSENAETYTLTSNMTFETSVDFLWNTDDQADDVEAPLLTELYTLIIKDSEAEISEFPAPGILGVAPAMTFGLYVPRDPTPLDEWECPGCSAAPPSVERNALWPVLTMCGLTIASFTWFVTGLGLE